MLTECALLEVWPDVGIRSSPIFYELAQKKPHQFYFESYVFTMTQRVTKYSGYFCMKICCGELSKSPNLFTLVTTSQLEQIYFKVFSSFVNRSKSAIFELALCLIEVDAFCTIKLVRISLKVAITLGNLFSDESSSTCLKIWIIFWKRLIAKGLFFSQTNKSFRIKRKQNYVHRHHNEIVNHTLRSQWYSIP